MPRTKGGRKLLRDRTFDKLVKRLIRDGRLPHTRDGKEIQIDGNAFRVLLESIAADPGSHEFKLLKEIFQESRDDELDEEA